MRTVRKQRGRHARRAAAPLRAGARRTPAKRPAPRTTSEKNLSQCLSLYSLTSSHVHSALNTLASIALVTNSAFAFAAITIKQKNIASDAILVFLLSLTFYILAVIPILRANKEIYLALYSEVNDIFTIVSLIQKELYISIKYMIFSISTSVMFFIIVAFGFTYRDILKLLE